MSENNAERFLRALYENSGDGGLSISYRKSRGAPITKWFTKDQLGEMAAYALKYGKKYNTYVNINPRTKALDANL